MDTKSQNSNMLLAFLTLTGVIAIVALVGFFMLRKGPEIIQGQAEVTEYRVSSKVPGRILEFRVKRGTERTGGRYACHSRSSGCTGKTGTGPCCRSRRTSPKRKSLERRPPGTDTGSLRNMAKAGQDLPLPKIVQTRKNLHDQGVMSAQKLDEVTAQRDAAQATEKAAQAQYTMAKNGAEREDKAAAAALVERAKGAVAEVESYIRKPA